MSPCIAAASTSQGHNDTICGSLVVKDPELAKRVYFHQNAAGAVLGPQILWLVIRGLKTLGVRLDRQQQNARVIADFLWAVTSSSRKSSTPAYRRTPAMRSCSGSPGGSAP